MTVALEAQNVGVSWEGYGLVVSGVSLAVEKGQTVCVVGRSGCGKTTLLHGLAGLLAPCEGRVLVDGADVTGEAGHVSYMLQKDLLLPSLRVLDNACLPLVLAGTPRERAREEARPLLARFGLTGCEDKWPGELSGGMRQRAAFLRTYLMGNDVVLLDEPFSALDAITRTDLRQWYAQTAAELGLASVVVTHDVDEAVGMASRVYVLGKGGHGEKDAPSTVVGTVEVARDGGDGPFELTAAYLAAKREVLALLG